MSITCVSVSVSTTSSTLTWLELRSWSTCGSSDNACASCNLKFSITWSALLPVSVYLLTSCAITFPVSTEFSSKSQCSSYGWPTGGWTKFSVSTVSPIAPASFLYTAGQISWRIQWIVKYLIWRLVTKSSGSTLSSPLPMMTEPTSFTIFTKSFGEILASDLLFGPRIFSTAFWISWTSGSFESFCYPFMGVLTGVSKFTKSCGKILATEFLFDLFINIKPGIYQWVHCWRLCGLVCFAMTARLPVTIPLVEILLNTM